MGCESFLQWFIRKGGVMESWEYKRIVKQMQKRVLGNKVLGKIREDKIKFSDIISGS